MISRDFFKVSSILQALKSAAPAASFEVSAFRTTSWDTPQNTHQIRVLRVAVHQSEFVEVYACCVERSDGSVALLISMSASRCYHSPMWAVER